MYLTLLDERVIVFHYGISSHSELQSKFLLLSRNENDVFQVIFPKEQLFQKVVLFSDLLDELCFLFKLGFEIAELSSFVVSWVRKCKTNVFDLNLRTNDLFRKLFPSRQCATNAYLFSNVVCALAQTFTLNVKTKSEKL